MSDEALNAHLDRMANNYKMRGAVAPWIWLSDKAPDWVNAELAQEKEQLEAEIALKADYIKRLEAENEELETQLSLSISMYEGDRSPMHNLQAENAVLIKRLWEYEHQASDERIRDEK